MKIALKDGAPRQSGTVDVNVSKNGNTLEISASAGTTESPPIIIEFYDGKLNARFYKPGSQKPDYRAELAVDVNTTKTDAAPQQPAPAETAAGSAEDELAAFDAA